MPAKTYSSRTFNSARSFFRIKARLKAPAFNGMTKNYLPKCGRGVCVSALRILAHSVGRKKKKTLRDEILIWKANTEKFMV